MRQKNRRLLTALSCTVLGVVIAGCAHSPRMRWPWHAQPAAPQAVEAIVIQSEDGVPVRAFPQFWVRNTLLIDLSGAASTGTVVLSRRPGGNWPARLAVRVRPAEIKMLEVSAEQRLLLPTSPQTGESVDLQIVPGVYSRDSMSIRIHW